MNAHPTDIAGLNDGDPVERAGQNVLALLQQAVAMAERNTQHAIAAAHKLSLQLRDAEDRIGELEANIGIYQARAGRAEEWLRRISQEIEHTFLPAAQQQAPNLQPGPEAYAPKKRQPAQG